MFQGRKKLEHIDYAKEKTHEGGRQTGRKTETQRRDRFLDCASSGAGQSIYRLAWGSKPSFTEISSEKKAEIAKDMARFEVWQGEY